MGVNNNMRWSKIGSGFGEPGGTSPPPRPLSPHLLRYTPTYSYLATYLFSYPVSWRHNCKLCWFTHDKIFTTTFHKKSLSRHGRSGVWRTNAVISVYFPVIASNRKSSFLKLRGIYTGWLHKQRNAVAKSLCVALVSLVWCRYPLKIVRCSADA